MLYALLMLLILAALVAGWLGSDLFVPLCLLAMVATAWAFAADITTPLAISL
jgi:Ca2+/Na+ antiporter